MTLKPWPRKTKLNQSQVDELRIKWEESKLRKVEFCREQGKLLGVSFQCVQQVINRTNWK